MAQPVADATVGRAHNGGARPATRPTSKGNSVTIKHMRTGEDVTHVGDPGGVPIGDV